MIHNTDFNVSINTVLIMHNCLETVATHVHGQVDIRIAWNLAANDIFMPACTVAASTISPSDGNRRLYSCSCHFFHRNSIRPACRSARQNYLRCRVLAPHKNATQTLYESTHRILQRLKCTKVGIHFDHCRRWTVMVSKRRKLSKCKQTRHATTIGSMVTERPQYRY